MSLAILFAAAVVAALPASTPDPAVAAQVDRLVESADQDPAQAAANLWRAAEIADKKLRDYERALALYDRLLREHPSARLARGAAVRRDYVARGVAGGAEPFRRFERVREDFATLDRREARDEVRAIVKEFPSFALADEALLWLGDRAAEDGDAAEARERYRELTVRFPESALVAHAWAGIGRAAFDEGDYAAAEDAYRRIAATSVAGADLVSRKEVERVQLHRIREERLYWVLGFLGLAAVAAAATVDPKRVRSATRAAAGRELLYAGPLLALLVLIAPSEGRFALAAVSAAGLGFLAVALIWADASRPALSRPALRAVSTAVGTLAGAAILYLVLYSLDLLVAVESLLGESV